MTSDPAQNALSADDRLDIIDTISGLLLCVDLMDWEAAGDCLAPELTVDFTSVGRPGGATTREEVLARWRGLFPGLDGTQHQVTGIIVKGAGDAATARSTVRAVHWIGDRFWNFSAGYRHRLTRAGGRWRIVFSGVDRLYEEGDRTLFDDAIERVRKGLLRRG